MEIHAGLSFELDGAYGKERRFIEVCRDSSTGLFWSFLMSDYGQEVYSSEQPDADRMIAEDIESMRAAGWTHTATEHP